MEEDVSTEYKESLRDLQFNSKPLINMLTMLAEENIEQAPRIVRTIEEHLQKVPIEMKLPVLYLIDSIMKNVGGAYCALFTQNIVSNFCNVFEKGDEKTRLQLFKLRQTWTELFPNKKLYGLDQRAKNMDPAWPIMAKPPQQQPAIHINPKFLEAKAPPDPNAVDAPKVPSVNLPRASREVPLKAAASNEGEQIQKLLLQKQQEFLALKQQKMQLEMHLQQQQQMKQKQEAEQLLKTLQQQQKDAVPSTPTEPTRLPLAMRDPRLQRASTTAESPIPSSSAHTQVLTEPKMANSISSKFRIPKVQEKLKKGSENDVSKTSSKTSPNKCRKSDEREERHRSSSGKSSASSSSASTSSSPGRNKKRRGKGGGRSATAENIPEKEPMGDVDMRVPLSREDHGPREEPPPKKVKNVDSLSSNNPLGDFDYRRPESSARGGWAQYKATHPDEFKSPLRPSRENMDSREQHLRLPPGCAPHNGDFRGGMQPTVDRFGRPLFRRLMSDPRFRSHVVGRGERHQLEQMLANPEAFLQQTEEQLRLGRLDPEEHRRIMADLEKLSQFRRSHPRNSMSGWTGGPLGNFASDGRNAPWNTHYPLLGVQEGSPDLPPAPEQGRRVPDVAAMDVDLRKLPGTQFSDSGPVGSPDRRPPTQEMSGWVRYGNNCGEERPANWSSSMNASQQPPHLQLHQDGGMRPRWQPNEWNSAFGGGCGMQGAGRTGNQPNFGGKEYPSYFREDFPRRQHMGPEVQPQRPSFPPRPQLDGVAAMVPPPPMPPPGMLPLQPLRGPPSLVPGFSPKPQQVELAATPSPNKVTPTGLEVNVEDLFAKLVAVGILKASSKKEDSPAPQESAMKKELDKIPPLSFQKVEMLKVKHPGVISALHVGTQCASCGLRFTDEKSEKYSQHLDWHFRTNRRDKDGARKAFSRKWFYEVEDWIQFEEIEDLEERARSFFEQQASAEQDQNSNSPVEMKSVPATGDETTCAVCEEAFQLFWVEEEEEWHFRDAIRVDHKIYHPACYEDYKRALEAPPSPPPSPVEEEEEGEVVVKEEDMAVDVKEEEKPMEVDCVSDIKEEPPDEPAEMPTAEAEPVCQEPLAIKAEKVADEVQDDPVVIIDNLGEFGVSASDMQDEPLEEEQPTSSEPKVVVKGSGGIVLKVKAESIQAPVSPAAASPAAAPPEEVVQPKEETKEDEEMEEFRPPTPDPRFTVLPPVQRGNELSGLCSIM